MINEFFYIDFDRDLKGRHMKKFGRFIRKIVMDCSEKQAGILGLVLVIVLIGLAVN